MRPEVNNAVEANNAVRKIREESSKKAADSLLSSEDETKRIQKKHPASAPPIDPRMTYPKKRKGPRNVKVTGSNTATTHPLRSPPITPPKQPPRITAPFLDAEQLQTIP